MHHFGAYVTWPVRNDGAETPKDNSEQYFTGIAWHFHLSIPFKCTKNWNFHKSQEDNADLYIINAHQLCLRGLEIVLCGTTLA